MAVAPATYGQQLTLEDALAELEREQFDAWELRKLGDTREFGFFLLQLLELAGWDVVVTAAFAGDGVLVIARTVGGIEVKRQGATVADVAPDLFKEAMRMPQPPRPRPMEV